MGPTRVGVASSRIQRPTLRSLTFAVASGFYGGAASYFQPPGCRNNNLVISGVHAVACHLRFYFVDVTRPWWCLYIGPCRAGERRYPLPLSDTEGGFQPGLPHSRTPASGQLKNALPPLRVQTASAAPESPAAACDVAGAGLGLLVLPSAAAGTSTPCFYPGRCAARPAAACWFPSLSGIRRWLFARLSGLSGVCRWISGPIATLEPGSRPAREWQCQLRRLGLHELPAATCLPQQASLEDSQWPAVGSTTTTPSACLIRTWCCAGSSARLQHQTNSTTFESRRPEPIPADKLPSASSWATSYTGYLVSALLLTRAFISGHF